VAWVSDSKSVERWREYRKNIVPARERQEVHEMPHWVKLALIKRQLEGLTYKEAAQAFGKKDEKNLGEYGRSPAAEKWLSQLQPFLEDPIEMAKALLNASAAGVTVDRFVFLELAKASGDYINGDKIAKDLQDRMGIVAKKHDQGGAIQVKIHLGGGSLDAPVIEAEWEEVDSG